MYKPLFITGNPHKAAYLAKWLDIPLEHRKLDLDEIQSLDLREVVEHKVRQAYKLAKQPVLVEDIALTFTAMGHLPGTLIRWFLEELGVDGLAKLADGLEHRKAKAEIMYALHDGRQLHFFYAERAGQIARTPRGSNGFGWNSVFIPDGYDKTYAEMADGELGEDEFRAASHRAEAIDALRGFLQKK